MVSGRMQSALLVYWEMRFGCNAGSVKAGNNARLGREGGARRWESRRIAGLGAARSCRQNWEGQRRTMTPSSDGFS